MPVKTRIIQKALIKKGFSVKSSGHFKFTLYDSKGRKMPIVTIISHGLNEYSDNLLSKMARQLQLEKSDFIDLIMCPLSRERYYEILRVKGFDC